MSKCPENKGRDFSRKRVCVDRELLNHRKTKEDEGEETQKLNGGERRRTKAENFLYFFLTSLLFVLSLSLSRGINGLEE